MNANELADELKEIALISDNHTKIVLGIAETMLRQQQALIEQLEKTQDYLYKTHDADKAEIEALKRHRNRLETLAEQMLQGDGND